jgi:hypothetical protein
MKLKFTRKIISNKWFLIFVFLFSIFIIWLFIKQTEFYDNLGLIPVIPNNTFINSSYTPQPMQNIISIITQMPTEMPTQTPTPYTINSVIQSLPNSILYTELGPTPDITDVLLAQSNYLQYLDNQSQINNYSSTSPPQPIS